MTVNLSILENVVGQTELAVSYDSELEHEITRLADSPCCSHVRYAVHRVKRLVTIKMGDFNGQIIIFSAFMNYNTVFWISSIIV